ncbi:hypothetical protein MA16_Dca026000 [Dendrobium catenatum]|uniref:Uncharacterized protein n=2 Tax=Dendrobium catenatum TaxID=906689 RepID=A0A2I0WP59_9ASPA|nr:hypothetical protein MA16_Dca026000 [Dendrobium catenatum]
MDSSSLPIKAIHSFHAGERNLYTRLIFDLYIDPSCSLHLIAFWLWLEEDGHHKNLINKIASMTKSSLRSAAHTALSFLDALLTNPNPNSFHAGERNLYTRLAFDLYIDPSCSLHLIAFWLWLEEDGHHKNLINKIASMTKSSLRSAAHTALSFLDALLTNPNPNPTSTSFQKNAINGIHYYLSNVCYKALTDLHEKAASQVEARRGVEMIGHGLSCVYLSEVDGLLYVPHGEGSSGNEARRYDKSQMIGLKEEVKPWISCFYTEDQRNKESFMHAKPGGEYRSDIPREERMLFVTFSNGYPLTEEELYSFFIR